VDQPFEDLIDREYHCRMPWHDIHAQVTAKVFYGCSRRVSDVLLLPCDVPLLLQTLIPICGPPCLRWWATRRATWRGTSSRGGTT
jgi:hypothetical protein